MHHRFVKLEMRLGINMTFEIYVYAHIASVVVNE